MKYMLSIDCGVNEIGVAAWRKKPTRKNLKPQQAFCIEARNSIAWEEKCMELVIKLDKLVDISNFENVVTEFPEVYGGAKGNAAAKKGDVAHMAHFCGILHAFTPQSSNFITVLPTEWKKQLKKEIMVKRLRRAIGYEDASGKTITAHAWDAIGIGHYFAGISINDKELFSSQLEAIK